MPTNRSFTTLRPTTESHRVTTLELFFDLVFVFAFTRVTGFMAESHDAIGVLQGLIILTMLWRSWTAYSWLANQTRIDVGLARLGFCVALAAMFIAALAIPEAFDDGPGGLFGPLVFVAAYFVVRLVHGFIYLAASRDDRGLRTQLYRATWPMLVAVALMTAGALLGEPWQTWLWLAGIAVDFGFTYLLSHNGGWRVQSAAHWAERYGLIVMLALGESIVSIGVGVAQEPIDLEIVVAALFAVGLSLALWWLYFDVVSIAAEKHLAKRVGVDRSNLATDAYSHLHFTLIAGIIVSALGVEQALHELHAHEQFGLFGSAALFGGTSLYLAGHAFFWRRVSGVWPASRLVGATVLLALVPVGAILSPLAAVGVASLSCAAIAVVETVRFRRERATLRASH